MVYKKVNKGTSMSIRDIGQRQGHSGCGGTGRVPKSMRTVLSSSGQLMWNKINKIEAVIPSYPKI